MKSLITSSNPIARRTSKPAPRRSASRPNIIEPLEARIAPAGVLTFNGAGAIVVDLAAHTIADAGNAPVSFSGFDVVNITAASTLLIKGTPGSDGLTYTPTGATAGTVTTDGGDPTINFSGVAGQFTIDPLGGDDLVTVKGNSANNVITAIGGAAPTVQVDASKALSLVPANLESLVIKGLSGDDTLTVDATPGAFSVPLSYFGGANFDTLVFTGTATSSSYLLGPTPDAGVNTMAVSGVTQKVTYAEIEPILDTIVAASLTVIGTNANNSINYTAGSSAANGLVSVDGFETIEFTNKTTLVINALAGDDVINLNNPNTPTGLTGITVNGGDPTASDTLIINGTTGNDTIGYTPSSTVGSGTVTRTGAPTVTFTTVEGLTIDGQGGTDALTVTNTVGRRVTYTPGSAPDAGLIELAAFGAGTEQVPLSFAHIGALGSVTIAGTGDILQLNGTSSSDIFNITGSTAQIINATSGFATVLLNLSNVFQVELRGLDGDDTFNLTGSLAAIVGGLVVDGGNSSAGDTVNLANATGAVNVTLGASTTVTGYGSNVTLAGVELVNANAATNNAVLNGTAGNDVLDITPTTATTVSAMLAGSAPSVTAPAINLTNLGTFTVDGLGGTDTVTVNGTASADTIAIVKGATSTVKVGTFQTVSITAATTEQVTVMGGDGTDTFNVSGSTASSQGLTLLGSSPSSNAGAASDTLNLTLGTGGTTAIVPGATPDGGVITNPDGAVNFEGFELLGLTGAAGANTLNIQGTHGADTIAVQFLGGANRTWVNGRAVASFANFGTVTVNALFGDDAVSLSPVGLVGVTTINVAGGDPTASDTLLVNGTSGSDAITYTPSTTIGAGTVAVTGAPTVNFTTTEHLTIDGQGGSDALTFSDTVGRRVTYTPGSAPDSGLIEAAAFGAGTGVVPLNFAHLGAIGSVTFAGSGDILQLNGTSNSDTFNVTGSTAQIINATSGFASVLLNLSNIFSAELRGLDGDDTFNVTGSLPALSGGLIIDGGNPSGSDTVNLSAATSAVNVTLGASPKVTGYGSDVTLTGIELLNANATNNNATFTATAGNDTVTVTPTGLDSASFALTSSSPTIGSTPLVNITNVGATLTADGGAGTNSLVFNGMQSGDFIRVTRTAADFSIALAGAQTITPAPTFANWTINTVGVGNSVEVDDQGAAPAKLVNLILNGNAAHSAALNFISPSDTFYTALDAHTELLGNDHGSIRLTDFGGRDVQFATAGTTAEISATDGNDFISLTGAASTGIIALINGHSTVFEGLLDTVNVYTGNGDDTVYVQPNDFVPAGGIFIEGDGPVQTDHLIVIGTNAANTFTFAATSAVTGSVAITGKATVSYEDIGDVSIDGLEGADTFKLASALGRVKVKGGAGSDTIDFTGAASGVIFDLDAVSVVQNVNTTGEIVVLGDVIENFIGTAFNDVLRVKAAPFARTVFGGVEATLPPGDTLIFDGAGAVVTVMSLDANTGTIKAVGYADVAFDEFESKTIVNSPSGPGGFGTPSNSDAFSTAHIYDSLTFKSGGKPAPGKGPTAAATGDLNGDGFADVVVANSKSKNISVLINRKDGTFLDPVNISTGKGSPQDVVLGNFDGDGNLDAVISQPTLGGIAFMKGDGMGGFAAPVFIATPKFKPYALAAGTIDGGATLDIVAVSKATNTVAVILGNGAGVFTPGAPVKTLGKNSIDVVVADFNGDGDLDVATANVSSNNVSFLAGDGTGALGAAVRFATGVQPTSLAVGDLDNDGDLDLAVSNAVSRFVTVLLSNGAAPAATQFAPQLRVAVPGLHQSSAIVVGDFDGDGVADLGLGNRASVNFTVLRGLGAGAYSQPYEFNLGKDPASAVTGGIALADFNNDGLLDIVATSLVRSDVRVLLHKV